MRRITTKIGRGLALSALVALGACEAAGTLAGGGSQSDYLVARQALETGNYDLAIRRYARLMDGMSAMTAQRLQLEYAHALLRGGRYQDAADAADPLIGVNGTAISGSALAVRGTARHEAARSRIASGQGGAVTRGLLQGARDDLAAFVERHANLDASGSMRARMQLIGADLQSLG
tara:strand:+ start:3096 stop:3623 length:528 start_codon:yes stop_codon:yes gene_type:complete